MIRTHLKPLLFAALFVAAILGLPCRTAATIPSTVSIAVTDGPKPEPAFVNETVTTKLIAELWGGDPLHEIEPPSDASFSWSCPHVTRDGVDVIVDGRSVVTNPPQVEISGGRTAVLTVSCPALGKYVFTVKVSVTSASWKDSSGNQITLTNHTNVTVNVVELRLKAVTFSGGIQPIEEDKTGATYGTPQWQDDDNDGAAETDGESHFPVSYPHGNKVTVTGQFVSAAGSNLTGSFDVTCSGSGLTFQSKTVSASGGGLSVTLTSNESLPNQSKYYAAFTLNWTVRRSGQNSAASGGSSDNRLYLTMGSSSGLRESIYDVALRGLSAGASDRQALINAVWGSFGSPAAGVSRKAVDGYNKRDAKAMRYWPKGFNTPRRLTAEELVDTLEGRCGAWADLFIKALALNGVTGIQKTIFAPTFLPSGYIAVMPWSESSPYWFLVDTTVPGQGNAGPTVLTQQQGSGLPGMFFDHAVVNVQNATASGASVIYDPSYDKTYTTPLDWEDHVVTAFETFMNAVNNPALVTWFNPDVKGQLETRWP